VRRARPGRLRRRARLAALGLAAGVVAGVLSTAVAVLRLREGPLPASAFMRLARRADPATGQPCAEIAYRWVDRASLSPHLRLAVVLAEDQKFLLHQGFDLESLRKAWREHRRGGRTRGASTVSQQLARNLFLWPDPSLLRKGLEAWLTLWIEGLWTKQRILEAYLNVAQFGPCVFGAEAAAERFFGRAAAELRPEQAALLAAVLPNPAHLRAGDPGAYTRKRSREILRLMEQLRSAPHLRGL